MKSKKGIIFVSIVLIICMIGLYLFDRFSFSNDKTKLYNTQGDISRLHIGIIGDSWAAGKKTDSIIHNALLISGVPNDIISSGHPGAKTKLIYENMFRDSSEPFSSLPIIVRKPQYCIIACGVNDAVGQVGKNFYAHHMNLIIKQLIANHIKPVVISLPEFAIMEYSKHDGFLKHTRNRLFALANNHGEIDNIKKYRKTLEQKILNTYSNKIILINFDSICTDYYSNKALYQADGAHLSLIGNQKLGRFIAKRIQMDYSKIEY